MTQTLESLRWYKFPVLDDGFVCLVDVMGDDSSVVQAARVSYGKDSRTREGHVLYTREDKDAPNSIKDSNGDIVLGLCKLCGRGEKELEQACSSDKDRALIRYLMRHRHTTPFEMAEIKLLVRVPMDCWRQWIRHRTASVNEYSTRYTEAIDSQQKTPPGEWRSQSASNKQGSGYYLDSEYQIPLSVDEDIFHRVARKLYENRLKAGVAREQARKDLPLSTYTEAYWKIDLHNLLHFLALRMDEHAQWEIRQYATTIGEQIVRPLFPMVWEAFEDYRLEAMTLTRLEIEVIRELLYDGKRVSKADSLPIENKREREECLEKLKRLGFVF